jgi:hypothetical protein
MGVIIRVPGTARISAIPSYILFILPNCPIGIGLAPINCLLRTLPDMARTLPKGLTAGRVRRFGLTGRHSPAPLKVFVVIGVPQTTPVTTFSSGILLVLPDGDSGVCVAPVFWIASFYGSSPEVCFFIRLNDADLAAVSVVGLVIFMPQVARVATTSPDIFLVLADCGLGIVLTS